MAKPSIEAVKAHQKTIRNFSIIAHIDHGKSTLADRILEKTKSITTREMKAQLLDSMDLERERGITIKLNAVEIKYTHTDGEIYTLHLIDTPGHVDFAYEVSRSLAACETALLVIDAAQGIEAQTMANVYLALDNDLEIIPVINKIDLPSANVEGVKKDIEDILGIPGEEAILASAKEGKGIDEILDRLVHYAPAPKGDPEAPLQALIFDSIYDPYRGVIPSIRVVEGMIEKGDTIRMMANEKEYTVLEVGVNTPKQQPRDYLGPGDVGYVVASIKSVENVRVGDTITHIENPADIPLPGYRDLTPMVFCGLFPTDANRYNDLREALERLKLNDASLKYEPENSQALGFGFRTGFLGMLHMEIVQERLEREFNLELIATAPSVIYSVHMNDGSTKVIDNPADMPEPQFIDQIEEPFVAATIMCPKEYVGNIMELCQSKRGEFDTMEYIDDNRVQILYDLPLLEIVYDFFDKLKSSSKGYASFDYEFKGRRASRLVKMDILINGEKVDALSVIVHRDFAFRRGKAIAEKLKEIIPRHMFEVPIQASINNKIIARSTIKAMRKNVLSKCYGGDISRKKKLLEKQKEGKKRMKNVGNVEVPQEAFLSVLSLDD
ncbi:MAG: translation elongation factor 4 [Bacillota bacterium]